MQFIAIFWLSLIMLSLIIFINAVSALIKHNSQKFYKLIATMTLNIIVWLGCEFIIQLSKDESIILFFHEFKFLAIISLPTLTIFYSYAVKTGHELSVKAKIVLSMVPIPLFILIMTNQYHSLFRISLAIKYTSNMTLVHSVNNYLFYVVVIYTYVMIFISLLNFIIAFRTQPIEFKNHECLLVIAILIPFSANFVFQIGNLLDNWDFDPTPIGFFLCICVFYFHFFLNRTNRTNLLVRGYIVDYMNNGLLYLNHLKNISDANRAFLTLADTSLEDIYDKPLNAIENDLFRILSELQEGPDLSADYTLHIGIDIFYYKINYQHMYLNKNQFLGTLFTFIDITELKQTKFKLEYVNTHDILTKLNNRFYFENKLNEFNEYAYYPLGLIVCDIHLLKYINDTKGRMAGDDLLIGTAKTLLELSPTNSTVCRVGSNEYAILIPNTSISEIETLKSAIIQLCCHEHKNNKQKNMSIGSSIKLDQDRSLNDFMNSVNHKLY
ncbi:MAG: diguanylate cyclase [Vallitaleaceae bacterium]|jgi:diguanylate cyclase (GGDEF)-like protein|nr:diguanylate cyclase [Vallitaleaceae bacterium]